MRRSRPRGKPAVTLDLVVLTPYAASALSRLLEAAGSAATLPGACVGGRVRYAMSAQARREETA